jgi:hypothetical protein
MTTYYLNGIALQEGADITLNGMTYPYSWLEGTSPSVRASLGIEKDGDTNFDTAYYWAVGNPKNLEDTEDAKGLKTTCTATIKSLTNTLLKPTDHYILRHEVEEIEIPETVSTYRAAVIAESVRVVTAIAAATTVEGLVTVMKSIVWPEAK